MSQGQPPRGRTGQKVEDPGTYKCEDNSRWTYNVGDEFRACPSTGKPTVWEKTSEPEHADSR
ncbi:hypothetical protein [Symbiobacterium terraclitae]|uniref:hypothetical protein n=1 Tax=Symbiobacterium terraclitae TaxID=557451 RepID=UPI0035B51A13